MLKLAPQQHIALFKVENAHSIIVYAVCVEVIAPGEYRLSEPRIVKVTPKKLVALPGAVVSPFSLPGLVAEAAALFDLEPSEPTTTFHKDNSFLHLIKANAPNIFA